MFFSSDSLGSPAPDTPHAAKGPVVWTRNKFLAGLAVATPLIVTFWILQFVYNTLHDWNESLLNFVALEVNSWAGHTVIDTAGKGFKDFNTFVGVLIPVIVLIALGTLASNVIGRQVVEAVDRLMLRVPLISFVYKLLKQVIDSFKNFGGGKSFKRVVYIDYPATGAKLIGFVTGQYYDRVRNADVSAVYVPGALSPMTGLLLTIENDKLIDAPLSLEDAMKLIFSGGLAAPQDPRSASPAPALKPVRADLPAGLPVADADDHSPTVEPAAAATAGGGGGHAARALAQRLGGWLGM